ALAVLEEVGISGPDQRKVNGQGNRPRNRGGGVDFEPLQAIVRKDADTVALCEPEARERIGEPARALVPHAKRYRPVKVARPDSLGVRAGIHIDHITDMRETGQVELPQSGYPTVPLKQILRTRPCEPAHTTPPPLVVGAEDPTRCSVYLKLSTLRRRRCPFRTIQVPSTGLCRGPAGGDRDRSGVRGSRSRSRSGGNPYLMLRLSPLRLRASQMSAR